MHTRQTSCVQKGVYGKACVAQPPEGLTQLLSHDKQAAMRTAMPTLANPVALPAPVVCACALSCDNMQGAVTVASQGRVTKRSSHNKLFSIAAAINVSE